MSEERKISLGTPSISKEARLYDKENDVQAGIRLANNIYEAILNAEKAQNEKKEAVQEETPIIVTAEQIKEDMSR